ncbi:MAG: transketolase [Candidatus Woesearchaeota archaeon]
MTNTKILQNIANKLRINSIQMTTAAGSGHPTSCMSSAEIMAYLFFDELHYNTKDAFDPGNDEFVLSKGHAAPILWAAYAEAGIIAKEKLLTLRQINSDLEGHPTPRMEWIKIATGSLGQGLGAGVGMALAQKMLKSPARTFVLMGDGEIAEGSVWEACNLAAHFKTDNLFAIVDVNGLGQSQQTMHGHDVVAYQKKFAAFGFESLVVDGHDLEALKNAFAYLKKSKKPKALLCSTIKGKGFSEVEDKNGWHGVPFEKGMANRAIGEIGEIKEFDATKSVKAAFKVKKIKIKKNKLELNEYKKNELAATRDAYGKALLNLGLADPTVVAVDGDVKNSTKADKFFKKFPQRSFECYIAEQGMTGVGLGLAAKGFIPFVATFAAFLSRAHDFFRMGAYSHTNCKFVGSHVGVSIGADGPSQMGLEDVAMFREIPGCVVLHPSDAVSCEYCVKEIAEHKGICYLRTLRPKTAVLYKNGEKFPLGGSKVLKKSGNDKVTVFATGITVHEALKAYDLLKKEGVAIQIVDCYSLHPVDKKGFNKAIERTAGKAVVVEDHYPAGGLGEAVKSVIKGKNRIKHLCIKELPRSGSAEELMEKYGISANWIVKAVKEVMK